MRGRRLRTYARAINLRGEIVSTMTEAPLAEGVPVGGGAREQTRARYPDQDGWIERDGARVFFEVYGADEPSVLFFPPWEIVHSRTWKCQVPYFARHGRVVTFDRRGNGRSSRSREVRAYDRSRAVGAAVAVLDRAGVERGVVVSWCGAGDDLMLAVDHPRRVAGLFLIAPDLLLTDDPAEEEGPYPFDEEPRTCEGWAKWNRHYWHRDWPGFLEFFFAETFTEPHSTKQIEDAIGGAHRPTPRRSRAGWTRSGRMIARTRCGCARRCVVRRWSSRVRRTRSLAGRAALRWPLRSHMRG